MIPTDNHQALFGVSRQKRMTFRRSCRQLGVAAISCALLASGLTVVGTNVASAAAPVAPVASAITVSADGTQVAMTFTQDLHPIRKLLQAGTRIR